MQREMFQMNILIRVFHNCYLSEIKSQGWVKHLLVFWLQTLEQALFQIKMNATKHIDSNLNLEAAGKIFELKITQWKSSKFSEVLLKIQRSVAPYSIPRWEGGDRRQQRNNLKRSNSFPAERNESNQALSVHQGAGLPVLAHSRIKTCSEVG